MSPRGRAALVSLVISLGLLDGLPLPPPERAAGLPPFWQRSLAAVGAAQGAILAPLRPLQRLFGVSERWRLFAGASRDRFRFELGARRGAHGDFNLLYRADDERHRFLAELIENRRIRGAWNPHAREPPPGYEAFGSFIAARVFAARPKLREVRLRMEQIRIRERGGYGRSGEFVYDLRRERQVARPERGGGEP